MTNKLDSRIPKSIQYDPVVAAKYNTKRDYYYHEDPEYKKHINEMNKKYMKKRRKEGTCKKYPKVWTRSKEAHEKQKQYCKKYYEKNKEVIQEKQRLKYHQDGQFRIKKLENTKLSDGLELREEEIE